MLFPDYLSAIFQSELCATERWLIQQTRGLKVPQKGRETNRHPQGVPAPPNWQRGSVQRELYRLERINLLPRLYIYMCYLNNL